MSGSAFVDQVLTENVPKGGSCLLLSRDLRRIQSLTIQGQKGSRLLAEVRWCTYHAIGTIGALASNSTTIPELARSSAIRRKLLNHRVSRLAK